jgi:hypothetical protein
MESLNKLIEKIPDVWFDWYARFIPGAIGILTYIHFKDKYPEKLDGWLVFIFILTSYLIGHVIQPISGPLVKGLENLVDHIFYKKTLEERYLKAKLDKEIPPLVLGKITKAHAEANSMLSISIVFIINTQFLKTDCSLIIKSLPLYFIIATIERVFARCRKIKNLYPEHDIDKQ